MHSQTSIMDITRSQPRKMKTSSLTKLTISKSFQKDLGSHRSSPSTPKNKVKFNLSLVTKTQKLINYCEQKVSKVPIRIGRIKCKFVRNDDETEAIIAKRTVLKKQISQKHQLIIFDRQSIGKDNPQLIS